MIRLTALAIAFSLFAGGCAMQSAGAPADPEAAASNYAISMSPADAATVLALVNYPGTDAATLDDAVGLDSRAAQNIAAYRAGADGVLATADDAYFADLGELDAVPYVGDVAFQKLQAYAATHPTPVAETVEGVYFRGWEAQTVVWAVDNLDYAALDAVLDARAAGNLVAARPLSSVSAMGPVSYVGPSALESLRTAATTWWPLMRTGDTHSLAGTFDGVAFDEQTATTALDIANHATFDQLTAHGMTTSPANDIIAARPLSSVAAVAAVKGVGTATMNALHDYASSGDWGAASCTDQFVSAVSPHLADLLFMSESDRPLDVVSYAGAGDAAPTAQQVLSLVGAPAGSTAELRSVANFNANLEPSSGTADPGAAAAVESAVTSQLSDVVYVAIHHPPSASDPYSAEVDVYLVGRTACGDLVGLHSVSVET